MAYGSNFLPMAVGAYGTYYYIKNKHPLPKRTPLTGYSTRPNLRGGKGRQVNIYKTKGGLRGAAAVEKNYKLKLITPVAKKVAKRLTKRKHKFKMYKKF